MEPTPRELVLYLDAKENSPFEDWLETLRDGKGRGVIQNRLNRIIAGNMGDCEPVGDGVHELRIDFGPGYRVYFGEDGNEVVLLAGGNKSTQSADIKRAKARWSDYNA
jgi:putative addiction module killer protein